MGRELSRARAKKSLGENVRKRGAHAHQVALSPSVLFRTSAQLNFPPLCAPPATNAWSSGQGSQVYPHIWADSRQGDEGGPHTICLHS